MPELKLPFLGHGGDYNPDQWRDCPEILDEDIRLMKLAGCNLMSVGIFAWSALEPAEGEYDFDWLENVLDRLHEAGISVFLATPSGARPAWMSQRWPEVLRVRPDGGRNLQAVGTITASPPPSTVPAFSGSTAPWPSASAAIPR